MKVYRSVGDMGASLHSWQFQRRAETAEPAWASVISSRWRQTFHIMPFTDSWAMSWRHGAIWVEVKQDFPIRGLTEVFPCPAVLLCMFPLLQFRSVNTFGFVTVTVSEHFLYSTNATADGDMSYFKLVLPHFWNLFCSGDKAIANLITLCFAFRPPRVCSSCTIIWETHIQWHHTHTYKQAHPHTPATCICLCVYKYKHILHSYY